MACKRSGVRIPIAPQVRTVNRNLGRRFLRCTAAKYRSARTSAVARLFGFGLRAEYLVGPHCCCMRLSSRVASRNAMTLLTVAPRGPRNGCYGEARQLADLSACLPPVQQASRSAHGAAGSGLPGSADTPGRAERPGAGTGAGSLGAGARVRAAGSCRLRRTAPGLASASRREVARPARSGACGSGRPFAPRILCAWRAQRRRHDESGIHEGRNYGWPAVEGPAAASDTPIHRSGAHLVTGPGVAGGSGDRGRQLTGWSDIPRSARSSSTSQGGPARPVADRLLSLGRPRRLACRWRRSAKERPARTACQVPEGMSGEAFAA
jgi:hypothetical protein